MVGVETERDIDRGKGQMERKKKQIHTQREI